MKSILIIEDDPIVGSFYRGQLTKRGYHVEVAVDGQKGLARIRETHPDFVLLDLMLPHVNGTEVLKQIRAEPAFQVLPIVVFTNAYLPRIIQEAYAAGATAVYNKAALTPRQLLGALSNLGNSVALTPPAEATPALTPEDAQSQAATNAQVPDSGAWLPVDPDQAFQAEVFKTFIGQAPPYLRDIRKSLRAFWKATSEVDRQPHLLEMYRKVHGLTGSAGIAGLHHLSQMTAALEVLLKELYDKPNHINGSTLRTVANTIDFIEELFQIGADPCWSTAPAVNILVVDDDTLSRRAVVRSLQLVALQAVSLGNPRQAFELVQKTAYDLILLDVKMPEMDGFELCAEIRAQPMNRTTPVIFVTGMTDFTSRARSTLSGGADLIGKPFLFIELGVKALTYVRRGQLAKRCEVLYAA